MTTTCESSKTLSTLSRSLPSSSCSIDLQRTANTNTADTCHI